MFHKISLYSLYSYYEISGDIEVSASGAKNVCIDNTYYEIEENSKTLNILDKNIEILFDIEKTFIDSGYYETYHKENNIELDYASGYYITGETIGRVDELTTYNGELTVGLNFDTNGGFSGIIEKTEDYVHYVFNANIEDNLRVPETGIEYYTFFDSDFSFLKYYPKNIPQTLSSNLSYKGDDNFSEYSELNIPELPEIDRGEFLSPKYLHESLAEINTLEDLTFSIFNIN